MSPSAKSTKSRTSPHLLQEQKPFRPVRFIGLPPWLDDSLTNLKVHTFSAILFRCFPDWKMQPRRIGNDTFFFILSGTGTAEINGKKFPLRTGTCVNFLRGVPHSITHNPKAPLSFVSIHYSARIFESLTVPEVLGFPPTLDLQNDAKAKKDFEDACRIFALRPPAWESGLNALVTGILLHIIWNYGKHLKPQVIGSRAEDLRRLQPALAYLRLHLAESPP
ncbi:MAG: cupin domain-containing protein, partial [Chthoniobacterales bacterium]